MIGTLINWMELGYLPDFAVRAGIKRLCHQRLQNLVPSALVENLEHSQEELSRYIEALRHGPIAVHTDDANQQHYEVPAEFYKIALGKHLKYSSGFWPDGCVTLDEAESLALETTCLRAELADGMNILELGCGWGSLTLYMAARFPRARIVALSNSASQRDHIESQAKARGLANIRVLTRNIVDTDGLSVEFGEFDRVVSVEMFEHLKNYEKLLERISVWLKPTGKLFVHIFTHKELAYPFETEGEDNWMGKYFFTGGQMPSHNLLAHFQKDLLLEHIWAWSGTHYSKTAAAWLENIDRERAKCLEIFGRVYGDAEKSRWYNRWRVFFMSCEELFGYRQGSEWGVSHYLFRNRRAL